MNMMDMSQGKMLMTSFRDWHLTMTSVAKPTLDYQTMFERILEEDVAKFFRGMANNRSIERLTFDECRSVSYPDTHLSEEFGI